MLRLSDCLKQESRLALRLPNFQRTFLLSRFDALMFAVGGSHDLKLVTTVLLDVANVPWRLLKNTCTLAGRTPCASCVVVDAGDFCNTQGQVLLSAQCPFRSFGSKVYTSRVVGMHRARCRRKQKGNEQKSNAQRVSPLPVMIVGAH